MMNKMQPPADAAKPPKPPSFVRELEHKLDSPREAKKEPFFRPRSEKALERAVQSRLAEPLPEKVPEGKEPTVSVR